MTAGQLLGLSDNTGKSTGPHLHFEVRDPSGRRVNPYGTPPDYVGGCGPGALWATCPPTPYREPIPQNEDGDDFSVASGDCDDRNSEIHPAADERCDGVDNNCDGLTDQGAEGGILVNGSDACTVGTGACARSGKNTCAPDGSVVCDVEPFSPSVEHCNGLDDDCDGTTDEEWRTGLANDLDGSCAVGIGACANLGMWVCAADGQATVCSVDPLPAQFEQCNGLDDDCDGDADEDWRGGSTALDQPCSIQWGADACAVTTSGIWICTPDGLAVVCDAPEPPNGIRHAREETCNGVDDDCDGVTDNAFTLYDEAHCGSSCDAPPCSPGAVCMRGECYTCTTQRDICLEHCLANYCFSCYSGECMGGVAECVANCHPSHFTDPYWFNLLCRCGCPCATGSQ